MVITDKNTHSQAAIIRENSSINIDTYRAPGGVTQRGLKVEDSHLEEDTGL